MVKFMLEDPRWKTRQVDCKPCTVDVPCIYFHRFWSLQAQKVRDIQNNTMYHYIHTHKASSLSSLYSMKIVFSEQDLY